MNASFEARLIPHVQPLSVTTNYAGPRFPTDSLDFTFSKWTEPTEPQLKALLAALAVFCNPRRLLRSNEIPMGVFFCLDGMSAGAIFLHVQGISVYVPERPADLSGIEHASMKIYRIFGSNMAQPQPGICGAAIVEDDSNEGGVAGFFSERNSNFALSPCLNRRTD